ncbi:MAG: HlyD family efflux transporter periplasmic adaptor subunit [Bacillota bacterium]|nr:HlyD family efflux transporter periplasmic adaptor subunit [Bacillota bacterium]
MPKVIKRLIAIFFALIIVLFIVYSFVRSDNGSVATETAETISVSNSINTTGFVVRDESYITNDNKGYVSYLYDDGSSMNVGGTVAYLYAKESDATAKLQEDRLSTEISQLQQLNSLTNDTEIGLDSVKQQTSLKLYDLFDQLNENAFTELSQKRSDLLYLFNESQIIMGSVKDFNSRIKQLTSEKDKIIQSSSPKIGEVTTKQSGYFVGSTDGYENSIDYNNVKNITKSDLEHVKQNKNVGSDVLGKIVKDSNWYIICPLTSSQTQLLTNDINNVYLSMPLASTDKLPVTVVAINQTSKVSDGVAILECDYMSPQLATIRNEAVVISNETFTGLRVSKSALHEDFAYKTTEDKQEKEQTTKKKVQGVFVKHGNELVFKQVYILYSSNDFIVCDPNPPDGVIFNGETIQLYDDVVTEGKNLYAGKVVH